MQTHPISVFDNHSIDTLIHLGAGQCSELDSHLALQPKRLILVEADPYLAEALQSRVGNMPQVQMIHTAVAAHSGRSIFRRYSLPDVNSLYPATGLFEYLPGLKEVEQVHVETMSPASLIGPLQLNKDQENRLIVDLPGVELDVLKVLHEEQQLHYFRNIQIYCGNSTLYEGGVPAIVVLQWLEQHGFDEIMVDEGINPDRPRWVLQRNELFLRNRELQEHIRIIHSSLKKAESLYERELHRVEELYHHYDGVERENIKLQEQLERLVDDNTEIQRQSNECHVRIDKLTQVRDQLAQLTASQQFVIQQMCHARDEQAILTESWQGRSHLLNTPLTEVYYKLRLLNEGMIKAEDYEFAKKAEHKNNVLGTNAIGANQLNHREIDEREWLWDSDDENLVERARALLMIGDWASLAKLDSNTVRHHPDRAKLILFAAIGCFQQGDFAQGRQLIHLAQEWGCSRRLVSQLIVAGVYNSLGRAVATVGRENANAYFNSAFLWRTMQ